ncbi:MAG: hypothetical protein WBW81_02430 [Methylocella sp.]
MYARRRRRIFTGFAEGTGESPSPPEPPRRPILGGSALENGGATNHEALRGAQDARVRLLKLLEDQTCTVKLLTGERPGRPRRLHARSGSGFSAASLPWA